MTISFRSPPLTPSRTRRAAVIMQLFGNHSGVIPAFGYNPPYNGPSHLRFNAKGGATYYFMVDTKAGTAEGPVHCFKLGLPNLPVIVLRLPLKLLTPLPALPRAAARRRLRAPGLPEPLDDVNSLLILTYYDVYNAPGVLVTVTRAARSGRPHVGGFIPRWMETNCRSLPRHGCAGPMLFMRTSPLLLTWMASPSTNKLGGLLAAESPIFLSRDYTQRQPMPWYLSDYPR